MSPLLVIDVNLTPNQGSQTPKPYYLLLPYCLLLCYSALNQDKNIKVEIIMSCGVLAR